MDAWLDKLPLLPASKARMEHKESWPEVLALQIFDRKVPKDSRTHGNALGQIQGVLDPITVQEGISHSRRSDPLPISERDKQVFLAAIQWLGTNIGRGFIEDLSKELESELKRRR